MEISKNQQVLLILSLVLFVAAAIGIGSMAWTFVTYQRQSQELSSELDLQASERDALEATLSATRRQAERIVSEVNSVGDAIADLQNEWMNARGAVDPAPYARLVAGESLDAGYLWNLYYTGAEVKCQWVFNPVFPVNLEEVPMIWLLKSGDGDILGYASGVYFVDRGVVGDIQYGEFQSDSLSGNLDDYNSPAGD